MTLQELIASGGPFADDAAALAWLRESVQTWQDVEWLDFLMFLHDQGLDRPTLVNARDGGGTPAIRTAAQYFLDVINSGQPLITSDSRVRAVIQASSMSGAQKTALSALAQTSTVRWQAESPETYTVDPTSQQTLVAAARAG